MAGYSYNNVSLSNRRCPLGTDAAPKARAGNVVALTILMLTVLLGFCSLAVDYGRVQTAKTELQRTADAAARAAAAGFSQGVSQAESAATAIAAANSADGASVTLGSGDIEFGTWDSSSRTFTVLSGGARSGANAIRVTARRSNVPLYFASAIGKSSINVDATSVASTSDAGISSAFIALDSFAVKNNLDAYSYNSGTTTTPTSSNHTNEGMVGSNGSITAKNNEIVGSVVLGPSGSHNLSLDDPAEVLDGNIPAPAIDFSAAPATNPGGVAQNYSVSGTVTLAAGTYYFTSLTVAHNAVLTFAGPSTVYVNGNINVTKDGTIRAYNYKPSNLRIRQKGVGSVFGGSNSSLNVYADVEAPQTQMLAKNNVAFYGRGVFKSIDAKNNAEFYYDTTLNATIDGTSSSSIALLD